MAAIVSANLRELQPLCAALSSASGIQSRGSVYFRHGNNVAATNAMICQINPSELSHIGQAYNLRITGNIDLRKEPSGICEGFSLLFLSYSLFTTLPAKKIRKLVLNNHAKECRFLQLLQYNLWGIDGKADQKILAQWKNLNVENIPSNIRKHMLSVCGEMISPHVYATILEIEAICEAKLHSNGSRYHRLEKDILCELLSLYKLKSVSENYFCGTVRDLYDNLDKLDNGIYHVALKSHAFVVRERYCCDVNLGIVKVGNPLIFASCFRWYFSKKKQWITISKIAPENS